MTPIPAKLREAIIRARAERFSYREIASMLGVGYATVNRILRLHRETNAVEPRPRGGGNVSPIHGKIEMLLRSIVEEMPDATVAELTVTLMVRSTTTTSRSGVQRALARLGFSRKKSFIAVERDTPENRARRRGFCSSLTVIDAERLVFIDESFCKTGMRREYGRSLRGERVTGTRPFRSWKTISLIGAIRLGARPKLMTHRGAVNGRTFLRFVKTRLGPWLRPGDIVVMDNLNMHKTNAVRQAIFDVGATVIYLPTYSPELNPIEMLWADMKRDLRTLGINVESELAVAIRRLRGRVPVEKIAGWFRHSHAQAQLN